MGQNYRMFSNISVYTLKGMGNLTSASSHLQVLFVPSPTHSPAPQDGKKLVHGPVGIGSPGVPDHPFHAWGSQRIGNSEFSNTWPAMNSRPTQSPLALQLSWVGSLLLTAWAEMTTPNFTRATLEKPGQALIPATLLT